MQLTRQQDIIAFERRIFVTELRKTGMDHDKIAQFAIEKFGKEALPKNYNGSRVAADVRALLQSYLEQKRYAIETVLYLDLERLDTLLAAVWDTAIGGDLDAVDRALKIMQQRAKLLGLEKIAISVEADWRQELKRQGVDPDKMFTELRDAMAQKLRQLPAEGETNYIDGETV